MLVTKKQVRAKVKEVSTWVAAAILGIGVALSISVVLMPVGIALVVLGSIVAVIGWLVSLISPMFFKYQSINCPYCREVSQVRLNAAEYNCDGCGHKLSKFQHNMNKRRHLTLVVNNKPGKIYGKPGAIVPENMGVSQK